MRPERNHQQYKISSVIVILLLLSVIWVVSTPQKPSKLIKKLSKQHKAEVSTATKEEQAIELLKGMIPAQIMAVISAINK